LLDGHASLAARSPQRECIDAIFVGAQWGIVAIVLKLPALGFAISCF
jgi:hypothetical protein